MKLSHLDNSDDARMVDVSAKSVTSRTAIASGEILIKPEVIDLINSGSMKKGNVLNTARIAGILAAKRTDELIPMTHTLPLEFVGIEFEVKTDRIIITATASTESKTGVEMEALTAVSIAALTIYDMAKSADKEMVIQNIRLIEKTGGKSGDFRRNE